MDRYRIRYRLAAVQELEHAIDWYGKRDPVAAERFRSEVRAKVVEIRKHPLTRAAGEDGARQLLIPPFPYSIVYRVKDDLVEILAFAHTSRQQDYWRERLED